MARLKKPRLRQLMASFLASRAVNTRGMGYARLKAATLGELGIDTAAPPKNAQLRVMLGKPNVRRRSAGREAFYESDEWRRVRYLALKMHGGCCQCCGARASVGKPLHVDHIKPRAKFPALQLDVNNLQVLCADCNLGKGAWDQTDWRPPQVEEVRQ